MPRKPGHFCFTFADNSTNYILNVGLARGFRFFAGKTGIKNNRLYRYQPVKILNCRFLKHRTVEVFGHIGGAYKDGQKYEWLVQFFVLFLSGPSNQSRPKISGPSTYVKNVFWPVLICAPCICSFSWGIFW